MIMMTGYHSLVMHEKHIRLAAVKLKNGANRGSWQPTPFAVMTHTIRMLTAALSDPDEIRRMKG